MKDCSSSKPQINLDELNKTTAEPFAADDDDSPCDYNIMIAIPATRMMRTMKATQTVIPTASQATIQYLKLLPHLLMQQQ